MTNIGQHEKDKLVLEYAHLIKYIAGRIALRLPPHIDIDDLMSAGAIGLIDAADKFDPSRDIRFSTYAEFRIRGAILDELRSQDWVSRTVRQRANHIENLYLELEQKLGRPATDEETAKEMGVGLAEFHDMLQGASGISLLSLDGFINADKNGDKRSLLESIAGGANDDPQDNAKYKEIQNIIAKAIDYLPKNEQLMISLYYYEELTMKEIADILHVTESRVSQIHTKAMLRLRGKLKKFIED